MDEDEEGEERPDLMLDIKKAWTWLIIYSI